MTLIEKLIEQRSELRAQFSPKNTLVMNQDLKLQIEQVNQKIRALVAQQDTEIA